MMNQVDLFTSLAHLTKQKLVISYAPDSFDMLDALLGRSSKGRTVMLEESFTLAVRDGNWKYIAPQTKHAPDWLRNKKIATGLNNNEQLYNLKDDIAEETNVADKQDVRVKQMQEILHRIQQNGTRPRYKK